MPDGKNPGFLSTPPINMFFGLREALLMLEEEGLENTFLRHERNATAVRTAIRHWAKSASLELLSLDPREHSNSISAVLFNETCDVANFRSVCRQIQRSSCSWFRSIVRQGFSDWPLGRSQ